MFARSIRVSSGLMPTVTFEPLSLLTNTTLRILSARTRHAFEVLQLRKSFSETADESRRPSVFDPSKQSAFLNLTGGNLSEEKRRRKALEIGNSIANLNMTSNEKLSNEDVVWIDEKMCLVGIGLRTNYDGFTKALYSGIFNSKRVAAVRDIFDRSVSHATLSSCVKVVSDDIVVILDSVQNPLKRRLVNLYFETEKFHFSLERHDMDFTEFLHEAGLRVIPVSTESEVIAFRREDVPVQQSTNHVLMVAPTAFAPNLYTAEDNFFMDSARSQDVADLQQKALHEYASLYNLVTAKDAAGLRVHLFTHETYHDTPDAVYPNNWFSTHTDLEVGECTLVLYPMKAPNRRKERRPEFLQRLFMFRRYTNVFDLTRHEEAPEPRFLEGTGSLVLDRVNRVAYCCLSERTDLTLARTWARVMGYSLEPFTAWDASGRPIYHTNVMMSVGTHVAVICSSSIQDKEERKRVCSRLMDSHEVVDISLSQVNSFCGNVLEVENFYGKPVMLMSSTAYHAFDSKQLELLQRYEHDLLHVDISTIERVGGGGVRCSIGELF
ncbi:hypothetical protein GpartN1_g533.t1 [Galdieria partita]|uniref:Amidinotransferase n=1 Tax=Galdieria partita TaxID=83374 RepID=A0A9C7PS79_9RHOD|nr:hypothetical protein GpartN1_g533.t1 [Galdieria partita]